MELEYDTPRKALNALEREFEGIEGISDFLGISRTHLDNYYSGRRKLSPTFIRALKKKGLLKKRIRSQVTWESQDHKIIFMEHIQGLGEDSLSKYLNKLAESLLSNMEINEND